jgi:peptidoglycan hydrolase-like protein with peptidoglycan-binding domain
LDTLGVDVNNTSTVQIMHLQEELKVLDNGLFPEGSISGKFDNATVSAVKRFQRFKSLDQTGKTGPATRKALNDILDAYR